MRSPVLGTPFVVFRLVRTRLAVFKSACVAKAAVSYIGIRTGVGSWFGPWR